MHEAVSCEWGFAFSAAGQRKDGVAGIGGKQEAGGSFSALGRIFRKCSTAEKSDSLGDVSIFDDFDDLRTRIRQERTSLPLVCSYYFYPDM